VKWAVGSALVSVRACALVQSKVVGHVGAGRFVATILVKGEVVGYCWMELVEGLLPGSWINLV
jgi:hypothetical protein